jgi:hypothetical protein
VTVTVDQTEAFDRSPPGGPSRRSRPAVLAAVVAALAVSPIVVAAVSLVGDTWYPAGDMAHILYRVSQVGSRATPLVGAETIKGWAHPGPLEFWVAAPLYRLTGEDPRALMWTAAAINVLAVAGIAAVAWRRGRWPLLLGTLTVVALLVHNLGPNLTVSLWNPLIPLLPWLCAVFLAWDVALGNRRALWALAVAACFAAQTHFAFTTLTAVVIAWLVAWVLWWPRLLPAPGPDGADGQAAAGDPPHPRWSEWRRPVAGVAVLVVALWLGPLLDLLFDMHNPVHIATSVATPPPTVGPVDAVGLVGRYVRPDGPWIGGDEPAVWLSVQGSGPFPLAVALAVLAGCLAVGRRRRLVDVVALSSLTLVLVVAAVPATAQIFLPAYPYLTQFLKLIGGLVWLTVGWTVWRVVEDRVRSRRAWRVAAGAVATAGLLAAVAASWGPASRLETPSPKEEAAVQALRPELDAMVADGERVRVEYAGDPLNVVGPGVIYWMIHDGVEVTTADGGHGLKWGHAHRWQPGERYDRLLTVAVDFGNGIPPDAITQCEDDPSARKVADYSALTPDDAAWLDRFEYDRFVDPDSASPAELARAEELSERRLRVAVYEGPGVCAHPPGTSDGDD